MEKLARLGARIFIYINPFLVPVSCDSVDRQDCPRDLYQEALGKGYLVMQNGTMFTYINSSINAGMIDLSNPDARLWIKQVIKDEMIGKAKASGWMGDFGEALPFDADLYAGADPYFWHNHYPEAWAQVQREAIDETGHGNDFLFWNRLGFAKSPAYSTAGWLGDQLQTWDELTASRPPLSESCPADIRFQHPPQRYRWVRRCRAQGLSGDRAFERAADALDGTERIHRTVSHARGARSFDQRAGRHGRGNALPSCAVRAFFKSLAFYRKTLVDEASKLAILSYVTCFCIIRTTRTSMSFDTSTCWDQTSS